MSVSLEMCAVDFMGEEMFPKKAIAERITELVHLWVIDCLF